MNYEIEKNEITTENIKDEICDDICRFSDIDGEEKEEMCCSCIVRSIKGIIIDE